MMEGIRPV
ncbi:hypothetical protein Nmel_009495 [Mimus melanotis]